MVDSNPVLAEMPAASPVLAARPAEPQARAVASQTVLALADQAVVSGTRFLTTLIVGRLGGPTELGAYTLAFGWLVLIAALQESLITLPFTVFGNRLVASRRAAAAGSAVVHYALLSAICSAVLMLGAALLIPSGAPTLSPVLAALAIALPLVLLVEFARRMALAHMRLAQALLVDSFAGVLWLGGLATLYAFGWLSAATAYLAIGAGCAVAGLAWLWTQRRHVTFQRAQLRLDGRRNWRFGRWVFATQMTAVARGYAIPWALALLHGMPAVGILSAYEAVLLICNPLLLGASNLLLPNLSQAFAIGRSAAVRRMVVRATGLLTLAVAAVSAGLFLAGEAIVTRLFGSDYAGYSMLMMLLAFAMPVEAVGLSAGSGLCALGRPRANFLASLAGLAVALIVASGTLSSRGAIGAAGAMLAGKLATSLAQCAALWSIIRSDMNRESST
jgi:O-antigen/teichoic acid export membrane protein